MFISTIPIVFRWVSASGNYSLAVSWPAILFNKSRSYLNYICYSTGNFFQTRLERLNPEPLNRGIDPYLPSVLTNDEIRIDCEKKIVGFFFSLHFIPKWTRIQPDPDPHQWAWLNIIFYSWQIINKAKQKSKIYS